MEAVCRVGLRLPVLADSFARSDQLSPHTRRQTPTVSCSLLFSLPGLVEGGSWRGRASTAPVAERCRAWWLRNRVREPSNRLSKKHSASYDSTTQRIERNTGPGTKGRKQKGQPRRAALFDASHNSAERRLRGLLETAEQYLNHLRVLLVGGCIGLRVVLFADLRLLPVAIEVVRLARDVGGVVPTAILLWPEAVRTEVGDEHLRLLLRRAVQFDVEVSIVLHLQQRIGAKRRIEFRADDEELRAGEIQRRNVLVRRGAFDGIAIELHRIERLDEFDSRTGGFRFLSGRHGGRHQHNGGKGDTTQT